MTRKGKQSVLLLIVILIMPVVLYGVYQLNSLTSDEEELTTIYKRQLESVLFTVNQTVQDKSNETISVLLKSSAFSK